MKQTEFENQNFKPKVKAKPEPSYQGEPFRVNKRTLVKMPANCKLSRKEWEQKMIDKYNGYDKRNEKARLTGAAKKVKDQL